jgi:hypothetical protein
MSKIRVLIKEPGKAFRLEEIENDLKTFQEIVGGYIECVNFESDHVIIVNEEGKLHRLALNFLYRGDYLVGTVVICGTAGEEFADTNIVCRFCRHGPPRGEMDPTVCILSCDHCSEFEGTGGVS